MSVAIIGDFGGTNARLAISTRDGIKDIQEFKCAEFDSPAAIIKNYCLTTGIKAEHAIFAVAGSSEDPKRIVFNNGPWKQKPVDFTQAGIENTETMNDFAAICYSIAELSEKDCAPILNAERAFFPSTALSKGAINSSQSKILESIPEHRFIAVGPGTGLGAGSGFVTSSGQFLVAGGEAGHINFAAGNEREFALVKHLQQKLNAPVSCETLCSGKGLVYAFNALAFMSVSPAKVQNAAQVSKFYRSTSPDLERERELAGAALGIFSKALGTCASLVALTNNARTVFLAGGILPKLGNNFDKAAFEQGLTTNDLGINNFTRQMAVLLITHTQPGLLGAHAKARLALD